MVVSGIQESDGKYHVSGTVSGDDIDGIGFSDLVIDGDVTFRRCLIENADLTGVPHTVEFEDCKIAGIDIKDCDSEDSAIKSRVFHPKIVIRDCRVIGLKCLAEFGILRIIDCRLEGKTDISGSKFNNLNIIGTNCEYMKATGITAKAVNLRLSRFVQLFDLLNSIFERIDMNETIVLETFRLPKITCEKDMFVLKLDNMTMNGRIILDLPGGYALQKEFVDKTARNNNSSGMAALRSVLESNRRFEAADLAFMEQKKKERDKNDSEYETNGVQRAISKISYVFSGNGMRPSWTLGWMILIILFFAIVYLIADVRSGYNVGDLALIDAVYLSIVSFFVCDTFAVNTAGVWLMVAENIIGLLMMLYFTVILTRKLIR